jgi:diaminohydroxyphosphoribosylaminopyrimidine deaminase / 5-amino-6-(5-phosphoribosylamino)uracil reductase
MPTDHMRRALDLAALGRGRVSPNPAVGAVVVRDDQVIGEGFHTWAGLKHAEIIALEQAGERARGATLYVTLEPCCHQGRTGPCTDAVIKSGVARVVAAAQDPNPEVAGEGFRRLRQAGIQLEMAEAHTAEAEKLNEAFFHFMRTGRPLVTLKAAVTLDGKIAAPEDNRGWITSERARAHVQQVRHESDAILTGIGTVLADDCLLTDRTGLERSRSLLRIVLDSQLRLPVLSKMVKACHDDVLVVTTSAASRDRRAALEAGGVRVLVADGPGGRTGMPLLIDHLASEKYLSLMIEAGSKVNWAALESGIVDRILFYYAPKIFGGIESLPVVGGTGRRRRVDAIVLKDVALYPIAPDEFAVEARVQK